MAETRDGGGDGGSAPPRAPLGPEERRARLEEGSRLMSEGSFFEAHEAFEDLWRAASSQRERELWQGLSQLAAALVKHDRGEPATAITLLAKARSKLEGSGLLQDARPGLRRYLDALAGPVAAERRLPATAFPATLMEALRRVGTPAPQRADGEALS